MEIPEEHVSKDYIANIANGETIIYGETIRPGMIVLIEDDIARETEPTDAEETKYRWRRWQEANRWCRVVSVKQKVHYYGENEPSNTILNLVCEYSNGDIMSRSYNASYAWVVKEESIKNVTVMNHDAVGKAAQGIYEAAQEADPWPGVGGPLLDGSALIHVAVKNPWAEMDADWENDPDYDAPIIGEIDPALEKLIAEEEAIEAAHLAAEQAEPEPMGDEEDLFDDTDGVHWYG